MFRRRLDRMTSEEVMWLPYGAREVELHPRTLFTGCIAYHDYVEPYIPYRCVRQLGYVQNVPPRIPRPLRVCRVADPNKYMLKFAEGMAEEQWDGFPHMNALNHTLLQFCSYNGITHRDYLPWYMKHSHSYVVNDRDYVPPAGPDVTLLEHWLARLFDKSDILFDPILEALPLPKFDRARLKLLELRQEMEHVETVAGRRRQGPPVRPPPASQD